MIVFDLQCLTNGETFEAWFSSSADFDGQSRRGLVQCPFCQSPEVAKAPMAPRIAGTGALEPLERLALMQTELLKGSRWVGEKFAETARAIHNGEAAREQVHGQATIDQARSLAKDGIPVAPLPLPVVPPDQLN